MTMSFHAIRAILFASATAASFGGLRLSNSTSHGEAAPAAAPELLNHCGGADHQHTAQGLVARWVITPSRTLPAVE